MQLFVVGAPRSGTTIVAQFLNRHHDVKIFDEIDLIQIGRSGLSVSGTLHAFLLDRGVFDDFVRRAREAEDAAGALRSVMSMVARPCTVWGEKNPRYSTQLGALRRSFPEGVPLFVLRDPRDIVNSCLMHRDSRFRSRVDFWIKDTVADALALVESHTQPLEAGVAELVVVRFEDFVARPTATLDAALGPWGLTFPDDAVSVAHPAPETVGDHQFFRDGVALPWKVGNLSPLRPTLSTRVDADDPAWAQVDALARRLGYPDGRAV